MLKSSLKKIMGNLKKILTIFILTSVFVIPVQSFCQGKPSKDERKLLKKARKKLEKAKYDKARDYYLKLIQINPEHPEYNFELGISYYNSPVGKENSVEYFEKALANMGADTIGEIFYYLGRVYQYVERFDESIKAYNKFKDFVKNNKSGEVLVRNVNRYIEMSTYGKEYVAQKNEAITVENLGANVNSTYPEYAPIFNDEDSVLIFTARKEGSTGGKFYYDAMHYEDIYITRYVEGTWTKPTKFDSSNVYISSKINSKKHDAAITLSNDKKKLYLYRKNHIWVSEKKDGKWGEPEKMSGNINSSSAHEMSVHLADDEKKLFVVSTRSDGFGGRDIYLSDIQEDGSWGPVKNLGPTINTPYDEDAPFLAPDGKTLYFSSKGHKTMGGYDIFKSVFDEEKNQWSDPENLGSPINTAGDDIYYVLNEDGISGYYASSRPGSFGEMDIYKLNLECPNIPFTEVRGLILAGTSHRPVGARIKVTNKETGENVGNFMSDPDNGKYLMVLPPGQTYVLEIAADRYQQKHTEELTLPKQCEFYQMFQEVHVEYVRDEGGKVYAQKAKFHDAIFDVNEEVKKEYGFEKLDYKNQEKVAIGNDDSKMALVSKIMHNSDMPAAGVRVYRVDANDQIVEHTFTDEKGVFRFENIDTDNPGKICIDESDLNAGYYGDKHSDKGTIVTGKIYSNSLPGDDYDDGSSPLKGVEVLLVDEQQNIVNSTATDEAGKYVIDNLPFDEGAIAALNDQHQFMKNFDKSDVDKLYSTFIKMIADTTSLNYNETIDLIDIELDEEVTEEELIVFKNILFDFNRYFLRDSSQAELDRIFNYLAEKENLAIEISGHADWIGTEEYNLALSEKRAKVAVNYLTAKGIENKRVDYKYFGEGKPVAPNTNPDGSDNPEGRQLNRRCEFKINTADYAYDIVLKF